MWKTYLDSTDWLKEIYIEEEILNWKTIKSMYEIKDKTDWIIVINNQLEKLFNDIYESFDYKNPLENKPIKNKLISKKNEIYTNFNFFCEYLIQKIKNAKTKKEIIKIPKIISNLYDYKWKAWWYVFKQKMIIEKRAEVMQQYKLKLKELKNKK